MTELLEQAIGIARDLPDDVQDEAARYIISVAIRRTEDIRPATPDEIASMAGSLAQADRGEYASRRGGRGDLGEVQGFTMSTVRCVLTTLMALCATADARPTYPDETVEYRCEFFERRPFGQSLSDHFRKTDWVFTFAYDWGSHEFVPPLPFGATEATNVARGDWRDSWAMIAIHDPKIEGFEDDDMLMFFVERDIARVEVRHDDHEWCVTHQGPDRESLCGPVLSQALDICDERTVGRNEP